MLLMASSFWGMAQEQSELNENVDPVGPHTPIVLMDPIATDRPDITESAFITPVGWFQYEGGYQYAHFEERLPLTTITDVHQIEEVLRFGLNQRFEVRAVFNSNTQRIDETDIWNQPYRLTGINPITIGFKYNIFQETERLPQTTWLSHVSLPWLAFGDYRASTQTNTLFHEQRLMMEKGLTDRFGVATNFGISGTMRGSNGFINDGMFSFAAGYDLGRQWGIYAEYFMNWEFLGNEFFYTPFFDGGITKLLSNDLQLDVYAGMNVSERFGTRLPSKGWFIGTGVSYRLPLAHYLR